MLSGIIFDIKEFAVHDGPGVRTTVFIKGCPLSCMWCHNPEGQSRQPQVMHNPSGIRNVGQIITSSDLAALLNRHSQVLQVNEGGITFSGGEPLMQAEFVAEVIARLNNLHVLLDTSGYGEENDFQLLLKQVDLVYFDLKLIDPQKHMQYTGKSNDLILHNLNVLQESGVPFVIRVPLIPGITDTLENYEAIASTLRDQPRPLQVDLLPYNRAAGAKYHALGRIFSPDYNEDAPVRITPSIFEKEGIKVHVS